MSSVSARRGRKAVHEYSFLFFKNDEQQLI